MTIPHDDDTNEAAVPLKLNISSIQVSSGDRYDDGDVLGASLGSTCAYACNTIATCDGTCCCLSG